MKKDKKKTGFTLAEVMIVLLVLTILFAVFAPFVTKRRRSSAQKQEVWMWSSRNYLSGPMDTYYKPLTSSYLGGIYIGTTPDSENEIKSSYTPLSTLTVRSGYILGNTIQKQLQLRYGRNSFDDPGQLAATFIADGSNLLFGANFPELTTKQTDVTYPARNVVFGFNAMNSIKDNNDTVRLIENNTAFGTQALQNLEAGKDNTAFGSGAGYINQSGLQNTLIGYNAGSKTVYSANTLIGYKAREASGNYNTFIGANTGNADDCPDCVGTRSYDYNVAIGYRALGEIFVGYNNVAIGSGALENLTSGKYNVAIGYKACSGLTEQSYKTCIGALSGPATNTPVYNELGILKTDTTQRTYIGANPNLDSDGTWKSAGRYGGDAVLEIHNSAGKGNEKLLNDPSINSNVTTIINGNLIVRGKTFLTMGDILYPFYYNNSNIFGTNSNVSCASNQLTYDFSNSGNCATLAPITSDRRLKNIKSSNNSGLDKVKQLKVYNYKFKDDKDKINHVGVIAQELQKIFPNSVFKGEDGYLKIKTDEIFYAVINSIKELNSRIVALIKRTEKFDKKITQLETENEDLQARIKALSLRIEQLKK